MIWKFIPWTVIIAGWSALSYMNSHELLSFMITDHRSVYSYDTIHSYEGLGIMFEQYDHRHEGRTLNMISFFIAMIEKRKCNELLIIAMKSQISSMKTDTFISSWKLLWPLHNRALLRSRSNIWSGGAVKFWLPRCNGCSVHYDYWIYREIVHTRSIGKVVDLTFVIWVD